jgi:hypothetical protein
VTGDPQRIGLKKTALAILQEHLPLLVLFGVYILAALLLDLLVESKSLIRLRFNYNFLNIFAAIFCVSSLVVGLIFEARPFGAERAGFVRAWQTIKRRHFKPESIAGFALVYLLIPPFLSTVTSIKQAYTLLHPFRFDEVFMRMDRFLHVGHHPWELVQPIVGYPSITFALDLLYMLWFPLLFGIVIWMAFSTRRRLRAQFFLCLCLVWILLGNLAAAIFSSAGPCYYARVVRGHKDVFAPLMRYLHSLSPQRFIWATQNQQKLWQAQVKGDHLTFGGISAMPSVHVAVAMLFALVCRRIGRGVGLLYVAYCVIVQLGSVHLGWHYAIDGYLSLVLTPLLWKLAGYVLMRCRWRDAGS